MDAISANDLAIIFSAGNVSYLQKKGGRGGIEWAGAALCWRLTSAGRNGSSNRLGEAKDSSRLPPLIGWQ